MNWLREVRFYPGEIKDLAIAWVALSLAFALFFGGGYQILAIPAVFLELVVISFITAGIGFLLHELAHKIVAIRYNQEAAFHANIQMLVLAIASGAIGFIFAAPGAVHHRGYITERENGIIAVAGPITNIVLGMIFFPLMLVDHQLLFLMGLYGTLINFFLAAFNLLPFGPLDGKKVITWSVPVFLVNFFVSIILLGSALFLFLSI